MIGILTSGASFQAIFLQIIALLTAVLLAITFHELAHGYVAYKNGDLTAKFMGRLTLNPIKHFDPIGFLMLALVGFGWAKPVPIDSNNFKNIRKGILTTSLAGVIMNFILAVISFGCLVGVYAIIKAIGVVNITSSAAEAFVDLLVYFFMYGITINLALMAFNILPIYPLDGFHVVESFTRYDNKYCVFMRKYGMVVMLGLIIGSSILGRISPYLNIFGLYIGSIQNGVLDLVSMIIKL